MAATNTLETKKETRWWFIFGLALLFVGACLATIIIWGHSIPSMPLKIRGYGDLGSLLSGTVGVCWSVASMFFFIETVSIQRSTVDAQEIQHTKDLKQREDELSAQKTKNANDLAHEQAKLEVEKTKHTDDLAHEKAKLELEKTKHTNDLLHKEEVLRIQKELFDTQQFENTFFNLAKIQQDIRLSVECYTIKPPPDSIDDWGIIITTIPGLENEGENDKPSYKSHEVFKYIKDRLKTRTEKCREQYEQIPIPDRSEIIIWARDVFNLTDFNSKHKSLSMVMYDTLYKDTIHGALGHYFRHLYHILLYIRDNEKEEAKGVTDEDKQKAIKSKYLRYAKFLQAQMSDDELCLTFYNAFYYERAKDLVIHFDFLENLYESGLIDINDATLDPRIKLKSFKAS